jgi:acylphosphatase
MSGPDHDKRCLHCYVSGRVQGVFYRASARGKAEALGLTGYARNLSDGRVELHVCGNPQTLNVFKDWLWQGPAHATVSSVECETLEYEALQGFRIRY